MAVGRIPKPRLVRHLERQLSLCSIGSYSSWTTRLIALGPVYCMHRVSLKRQLCNCFYCANSALFFGLYSIHVQEFTLGIELETFPSKGHSFIRPSMKTSKCKDICQSQELVYVKYLLFNTKIRRGYGDTIRRSSYWILYNYWRLNIILLGSVFGWYWILKKTQYVIDLQLRVPY